MGEKNTDERANKTEISERIRKSSGKLCHPVRSRHLEPNHGGQILTLQESVGHDIAEKNYSSIW